jgi:hypothetical protein
MFGNTAAPAGDVLAGLVDLGTDVALTDVGAAPERVLQRCDLLVLAAPTHALTLSGPASRTEAVSKGADPVHATTGLREWLATLDATLPPPASRPSIAVFDTRVIKARHWPGSAARSTARILQKSGFVVVDRASFYVDDITGPLSPVNASGHEWGRGLAGLVQPGTATYGRPLI